MPPGNDIFSTAPCGASIVCAEEFHFRVRDGNGWYHLAQITREHKWHLYILCFSIAFAIISEAMQAKLSTISTAKLNKLPYLHLLPIKQVVYLRSYPPFNRRHGDLILGWISHLDAFSAYSDQT